MCDSARLYNCARCHQQVIICSHCDRGNIYCMNGCSRQARTTKQKEAAKRYQSSLKGRQNHARRQHQYRQRQQEKVTHQGTLQLSLYDLLLSEPEKRIEVMKPAIFSNNSIHLCHFCGRDCGEKLRFSFLHQQHSRIRSFGLKTTSLF